MIACGEALPVTPMELVSRLTEQLSTPGTALTAFSTRALHAAQLMPVTLYCSILFTSVIPLGGIIIVYPWRVSVKGYRWILRVFSAKSVAAPSLERGVTIIPFCGRSYASKRRLTLIPSSPHTASGKCLRALGRQAAGSSIIWE